MVMAKTEEKNPLKIALIDDHAVVRAGLRALIEKQPDLRVCGEAATGQEAMALVEREQPEIVILDLDLGGESGLDLISKIVEAGEETRIIVLTGMRDPEIHRQAVSLGALGVVNKEDAADVIVAAINRVRTGGAWLDPKLMAALLSQFSRGHKKKEDPEAVKIASLSKRELEVVKLVGEGLKSKDIAERLFISEITVRHHLTSIFSKLEVSDRVELMLYAYKTGLAKVPV